MQRCADQIVPDELERQHQPDDHQSVLRRNHSLVVPGPDFLDDVEHEVSENEAQNSANNWGHVKGCEVAEVEVVSWDDED